MVDGSSLVQHSTGCPTIVAVGPSQSGKSTALRVALSIVGMLTQMQLKLSMTPNICNPWHAFLFLHFSAFIYIGLAREAIYERVTNAFILERAAASTLPFAVDDPAEESSKQCNIGDIIVDLNNGGRTGSMRKGLTCAASAPLIVVQSHHSPSNHQDGCNKIVFHYCLKQLDSSMKNGCIKWETYCWKDLFQ